MFHQRMCIAIERNGRVLVPEDLGERFYIHTAFKGASSKGMPQGMKALMRNIQSFQEQFKTSLVGTNGYGLSVRRHHGGRIALFLYAFENRQQLFRQRYHAAGSGGFRLVYDKPVFAVMTGLGNGENAFYKVYMTSTIFPKTIRRQIYEDCCDLCEV